MSSVSDISSIDQMVAQYRASKRKPIKPLETKKTDLNRRLSVLADLKTKLKTLMTNAEGLKKSGTISKFRSYTVASTDSSLATATTTTTAALGTHTLRVSRLAKNDTLLSDRKTSASTSVLDSEGAGSKTIRVSVNGTDTDVTIDLVAGDTNEDIIDKLSTAINDSAAAVNASSVNDTPSTTKLVLIGQGTGSSNAISLSDVSGSLLEKLGLSSSVISGRTANTSTGAGYAQTSVSDLNSLFTVDGITVEKETNTVSDVLKGVTLELKGVHKETDPALTLTVGVDKAAVQDKVQKFITDYNAALSYINQKTAYDPTTKTREALSGDAIFSGFRFNLRQIAATSVDTVTAGNPTLLSEIGVTVARDGTLSLSDTTTFNEMLETGVDKVEQLFNSSNGIANKLYTLIDTMTNSTTGKIGEVKDTTDSQILTLTNRITRFDTSLDKYVAKYKDDFLKLQASYNQILGQQQTISALFG